MRVDPTSGNPLPTDAEVQYALNKLARHRKPTPEEDTLDNIILKPAFWKFDDYRKAKAELKDYIKAQRQSDLKKISFQFAIPIEDLEKALESKVTK